MNIPSTLYLIIVNLLKGHELRKFKIVKLNEQIQSRIKSNFAIIHNSKMYLGDIDNYNLSIFGVYEPKEPELVKKEIKKNYTVLDLGASIGYYTYFFHN